MIKKSGMVITQTPLRISFLGGGTDYPEHFGEHGGSTLGSSINKYIYITINPLPRLFKHRIRVSYSQTELCNQVDEIKHPAVRECLRFTGIEHGIEINVISDLPARSGLGSSSAFTVGLLHALHAAKGELASSEQLAEEAVFVEREMIPERVGLQDQYACACGGFLHLTFSNGNHVKITPVLVPQIRLAELQSRLMLFYTGVQRSAHEVLEEQMERTKKGELLSDLQSLRELVDEGVELLSSRDPLDGFGELLDQGWRIKRGLSKAITTSQIDEAYQRARKAGAVGGKLLGAGGGGFLLVFARSGHQDRIREALPDLREVGFSFENRGSRLIFYRPMGQ